MKKKDLVIGKKYVDKEDPSEIFIFRGFDTNGHAVLEDLSDVKWYINYTDDEILADPKKIKGCFSLPSSFPIEYKPLKESHH